MWQYQKKLQYPVNIKNPNPKYAQIIISQYGGPDGELGASMRYLTQRYGMPYYEGKGILTDVNLVICLTVEGVEGYGVILLRGRLIRCNFYAIYTFKLLNRNNRRIVMVYNTALIACKRKHSCVRDYCLKNSGVLYIVFGAGELFSRAVKLTVNT